MNTSLLPCLLLLAQLPTSAEVTEEKRQAVTESVKNLDGLAQALITLGDPGKRDVDEDPEQYSQRAERIFKTRAYLLIKMQQEYERALDFKYALEADLKHFDLHVADLDQQMTAAKQRGAAYMEELAKRESDLRRTARLFSHRLSLLLASQAQQLEKAGGENSQAEAKKLRDRAQRLEAFAKYEFLTDAENLEKQHANVVDRKVLEEELAKSFEEIRVLKFDQNYVNVNLDEFGKYRDLVSKSILDSIDKSRELLRSKALKELELRARNVSVMSRHMRGQLATVAEYKKFGEIRKRVEIQKMTANDGRMQEYMRLIAGPDFAPAVDEWADLLEEDSDKDPKKSNLKPVEVKPSPAIGPGVGVKGK